MTQSRKPYVRPQLQKHGKVETITQSLLKIVRPVSGPILPT
jgi:hypothetical protein